MPGIRQGGEKPMEEMTVEVKRMVGTQLDVPTIQWLEKRAQDEDRSIASIIRQAIKRYQFQVDYDNWKDGSE